MLAHGTPARPTDFVEGAVLDALSYEDAGDPRWVRTSGLPRVKLQRCLRRDVCAGQAGRARPILRVQTTQYERRGGCGADENGPVIRRHGQMGDQARYEVYCRVGGGVGEPDCRHRCRQNCRQLTVRNSGTLLPHTRRSCADDRMCQGWRSHRVVTSKTPSLSRSGNQALRNEVALDQAPPVLDC